MTSFNKLAALSLLVIMGAFQARTVASQDIDDLWLAYQYTTWLTENTTTTERIGESRASCPRCPYPIRHTFRLRGITIDAPALLGDDNLGTLSWHRLATIGITRTNRVRYTVRFANGTYEDYITPAEGVQASEVLNRIWYILRVNEVDQQVTRIAGYVEDSDAVYARANRPLRSYTYGDFISFGVASTSMTTKNYDAFDRGYGLYGRVSIGLTPAISMFVEGERSVLDQPGEGFEPYKFYQIEAGARASFLGMRSRIRPYAQAAGGVRRASVGESVHGPALEIDGWALVPAAGIEIFLTPTVSLDAGAAKAIGDFFRGRHPGDEWQDLEDLKFRGDVTRFRVGLAIGW